MAADQLRQLLRSPDAVNAQQHARQVISTSTPHALVPSKLASTLAPLLSTVDTEHARLSAQLDQSKVETRTLVQSTNVQLEDVLLRTRELKVSHEALEDALIDHRESLVSSLSQREQGLVGNEGGTLRERLHALSSRRQALELAKEWFTVAARAEELGIVVLRALELSKLPEAFAGYVALVEYIQVIHSGAKSLSLASHVVAMASSVWHSLVKALSTRLIERMDKLGWPTPLKQAVNWSEGPVSEFRAAFVDLLELETVSIQHPLPSDPTSSKAAARAAKPLLALTPLVHPLILRFRWHFDGTRGTNRIDKPEYPLSHVLNLLSTHERFLTEDIQELLDTNGFAHVDAMTDFTTLFIPLLSARLKHHIPQLLPLPPVLAHTIYQTLEFDTVLRTRKYRPRGHVGAWAGLSEVILGSKDWYAQWIKGEREFFDSRYYSAISASDAWQILSETDYDAADAKSGIRPTNSALRVAELAEQLADRYRPIPDPYTLPFLLSLHLPLLDSYAQRITSSLDAFETLSFGLGIPGALADGRAATAGVGGVVRLVRAGVSARWIGEKCLEWGEDVFFLALHDYLKSATVPFELQKMSKTVLDASEGTLFDAVRKNFEKQADRSEELVVRHVVREILGELKSYLGRRWDFTRSDEEKEEDMTLTPDLIAPLSLLAALLKSLTSSLPIALSTTLYRRIATGLSVGLYDRLLVNRAWSEDAARQLIFDLEHGFLQAGREAGVQRGVGRGWEIMVEGAKVMAIPSSSTTSSGGVSFSKVMQSAWDDSTGEGEGSKFADLMTDVGVGETLSKREVQAIMRRRPECWR